MRKNLCTMMSLWVLLASTPARADVATFLNHLGHDAGHTFLSWPAWLMFGGGIATGVLVEEADQSIQEPFRDGRHLGAADTFFRHLGESYVIDSSALALYGAGKLAGNETLARTGETLIEALLLTEVSTFGLKFAFRRERPNGENLGFPSGHASRSFAAASVLQTLHGPAIGVPALLVAGLIAFSRLDENRHNASDIIFGAAWGTAWGWGTARYHNKLFQDVTITPLLTEGTGLLVSYQF